MPAARRARALAVAVAVAAVTLGACGGGGDEATGPAGGQELFQATCARCHGADGAGRPQLGKDLTRNGFVASHSDAELVTFLERGRSVSDPDNTTGRAMPPFGGDPDLGEADLQAIVTFLRGLQ